MRSRRRHFHDVDFWPAFTDVLAGMLLAMVLVLTLFAVTQAGMVHVASGKETALRMLEEQAAELRRLLGATESRADALQAELLAVTDSIDSMGRERDFAAAELITERSQAEELARQLREYVEQLKDLGARLAGAEQVAESRQATAQQLQAAINQLRAQLARMSGDLATAEKQAGTQRLRLSELVAEMTRKDQRIAELERLEAYTSEFLAKMSEVFADNPNIRVVGDRFVFQSEVLFASGSADLGEAGHRELDKFVAAFRGLLPRIPKDLDVNVQVQGHTDADRLVDTTKFADNWELSTARALEVVQYLGAKGIASEMLSAAGFGEHQPRVAGSSPQAKALNRRIEIRITRR